MDLFDDVYVKLWRRAEAEDARVQYIGPRPGGYAGYFYVTDFGKPVIAISRPYYKSPSNQPTRESNAPDEVGQPDLLEELITLAHEYGHFRSRAGRTEPSEYQMYKAALDRKEAAAKSEEDSWPEGLSVDEKMNRLRSAVHAALTDDDRDRILREETLAWTIGCEILAELEFADFKKYDERTTTGLHFHRYRLGMEDLWPGDGGAAAA